MSMPTVDDNVVSTEFEGGEGVLVDMNRKRYFQLNETAMLVWRNLEDGRALDEIVRRMTAAYDVDEAHAAASVQRIVAELGSYQLTRDR